MAPYILKYTKEALAFITLYRTMRPEVKEEIREMISKEKAENPQVYYKKLEGYKLMFCLY